MESKQKKILVADPRVPERTVLVSILTRLGYVVSTPETVSEAKLELKNSPDMMILSSSLEGAQEFALNIGSPELRVLMLDPPPDKAPDMAGFFDITEHILRGISVTVPEIIMLVNDFITSHSSGKTVKRQPRVAGGYGAEISYDEVETSGVIFNLSATGAFIELLSPPARGTIINVSFILPGRSDGFSLKAKVTWSVLPEESSFMRSPPGCGVYFYDLNDDNKEFLEEFVTHKGRIS
ncbi:MAG: PilZ domain-containing protein [Deltaproteobacteria bacterium]|nr:PilZ domain-containing protein [Deltaproteobacteria bacterium]